MRVAHIIKVTRISGAERHLLLLLTGLRERGIDARMIILVERDKPMDDMMAEAREREIPVSRFVIRRDNDLLLLWKLRGALTRDPARYRAYSSCTRRSLRLFRRQGIRLTADRQQPT